MKRRHVDKILERNDGVGSCAGEMGRACIDKSSGAVLSHGACMIGLVGQYALSANAENGALPRAPITEGITMWITHVCKKTAASFSEGVRFIRLHYLIFVDMRTLECSSPSSSYKLSVSPPSCSSCRFDVLNRIRVRLSSSWGHPSRKRMEMKSSTQASYYAGNR